MVYVVNIEFLRPTERFRVMDLLETAGVDITDWRNYKRGEKYAASNPKYCYEWTFENQGKGLIVLNLWYGNLEERAGSIIQRLNMRALGEDAPGSPQKRRARDTDSALSKAAQLNCPLRVIICDGTRREDTLNKKSSKTGARMLDEEPWVVESYDKNSGECVLVRGAVMETYIDQFYDHVALFIPVNKTENTVRKYSRSSLIRKQVLERANGHCEFCGMDGFTTSSGKIYLETHHIVPLSEFGADSTSNVIALCPNHHREAHFGIVPELRRVELNARVSELNKSLASDTKTGID